jgi:hypothetical protein
VTSVGALIANIDHAIWLHKKDQQPTAHRFVGKSLP